MYSWGNITMFLVLVVVVFRVIVVVFEFRDWKLSFNPEVR